QEPAGEIDVVNVHIEENPARRRDELDLEWGVLVEIDGLGPNQERLPDRAFVDESLRLGIARVESPDKADEVHEIRPRADGGLHGETFIDSDAHRLLAEYVEPALKRRDTLLRVTGRRRN